MFALGGSDLRHQLLDLVMVNVCTVPERTAADQLALLGSLPPEQLTTATPLTTLELFFLSSALSVGDDSPLRIKPDNTNGGRFSSLAQAWLLGGAYAIQPLPNVVPVDIDDEGSLPGVRDALELVPLPVLEIASGGVTSQRRHFWIWCRDESEARAISDCLTSSLGGEAVRYGRRMRPPGAPHRNGTRLAFPVDSQQARSWASALAPDWVQTVGRLSPGLGEQLEKGVDADRSKSDFRLMRALIANGCSDAEIASLAMLGKGHFGIKARERGDDAGLNYVLRSVAKARSNPKAIFSSRQEAEAYLREVERAVDSAGPTPFGGSTGKKLMRGAVQMFSEQSTIGRPLAIRDLAVRAQMSTSTVRRWLPRLNEAGWLVRTASGKGHQATEYTLKTPEMTTLLSTLGGVNKYVVDLGLSGIQSFRHGNLNESGREVVLALFASAGTARTGQILEATGRSSSTVASALSRLQKEDIVEKVSHGIWRLLDVDWNLLDEQTGADVVAKQQRASIDRERQQYGNYQIRRMGLGLEHQFTALDSRTAVSHETGELVPISEIG